MNKEKQVKKMSKSRQEYLKFKPFADDLRKAESWCELDGVLNRYQTVKNLSKMGYRKAADVERDFFEEIESKKLFVRDRVGNMRVVVLFEDIAELKKKYTETEKDNGENN